MRSPLPFLCVAILGCGSLLGLDDNEDGSNTPRDAGAGDAASSCDGGDCPAAVGSSSGAAVSSSGSSGAVAVDCATALLCEDFDSPGVETRWAGHDERWPLVPGFSAPHAIHTEFTRVEEGARAISRELAMGEPQRIHVQFRVKIGRFALYQPSSTIVLSQSLIQLGGLYVIWRSEGPNRASIGTFDTTVSDVRFDEWMLIEIDIRTAKAARWSMDLKVGTASVTQEYQGSFSDIGTLKLGVTVGSNAGTTAVSWDDLQVTAE